VETRSANVLFGDVKGYSALDNRQLRTFAETILPLAAKRIEHYSYFHVNTWGDGIIVASEDILDAATIAVELRDLFENLDWNRHSLPPLDIRLSLHHGEYYKGVDPFTNGGLLTGRSIILAARIEPITTPGRIWITEAAAVMLRDAERGDDRSHFAADEIGPIALPKGAGEETLFLLRRCREAPLSQEERDSILAASRIRRGRAQSKASDATDAGEGADFEVCIGVVVNEGKVLLVRRNRDRSGLEWMFPSGKKLSVDDEKYVVVKEVKQETGVSCVCLEKIADVECHPLTGARCHFYHLRPLDAIPPRNLDVEENADARYVPVGEVSKFITQHLTPEVAAFLAEQQG
jgi:class 3 adenylate cyclase/8-oxo-dGTP pyrophosphatase MutT (NUDIX family)